MTMRCESALNQILLAVVQRDFLEMGDNQPTVIGGWMRSRVLRDRPFGRTQSNGRATCDCRRSERSA